MSKLQTLASLVLGLVASVLLSTVLVLVLPFSQGEKFLAAAFAFPAICAFLTVLVVRGWTFLRQSNIFLALIILSSGIIFLFAPL